MADRILGKIVQFKDDELARQKGRIGQVKIFMRDGVIQIIIDNNGIIMHAITGFTHIDKVTFPGAGKEATAQDYQKE
jgi:hypothetical protein